MLTLFLKGAQEKIPLICRLKSSLFVSKGHLYNGKFIQCFYRTFFWWILEQKRHLNRTYSHTIHFQHLTELDYTSTFILLHYLIFIWKLHILLFLLFIAQHDIKVIFRFHCLWHISFNFQFLQRSKTVVYPVLTTASEIAPAAHYRGEYCWHPPHPRNPRGKNGIPACCRKSPASCTTAMSRARFAPSDLTSG